MVREDDVTSIVEMIWSMGQLIDALMRWVSTQPVMEYGMYQASMQSFLVGGRLGLRSFNLK